MLKAKYLILFFLTLFCYQASAQDIGNFTQFFFNPYSLNPSFAGVDGRPALFAAYRKQWSGIADAPTISNFSFHTPLKNGLNFGLNVANDTRGVLNNSGLLLSMAYSVPLGEAKYLRFGLSAGGSWNTLDIERLQDADPNFISDQALNNLLNQNASIIGNAGLSLHLKSFHVGAAIPNLFAPAYVSKDAFSISEVKPFEAIVVHASNRFYFADNKHIFEPYVVYRMNNGLPSQYEAAAVIHLNHMIWLGGSYKQDFGISGFGGIKLNKSFAIGASYSIKNTGINELNFPSYEVQLSYLGGASKAKNKSKTKAKSKSHATAYSFVDTEIKKLTTKEKLAELKQKQELEKQKQQAELAKKEAETKKETEALAKKQEEATKKAEQEAIKKAQEEEQIRKAEEEKAKEVAARNAAEKAKQEEQNKIVTKEKEAEQIRQTEIAKKEAENKEKVRLEELAQKEANAKEQARLEDIAKKIAEQKEKERLAEIARQEALKKQQTEIKNTEPIKEQVVAEEKERYETVVRGKHPQELEPGNYVIVGVFGQGPNARNLARRLVDTGFNANYGYLTEKGLWYVHVFVGDDINGARIERDKYRRMPLYKSAWCLTVQE